MDLRLLVLENIWILEILYAVAIAAICLVIFSKTDRIYKLSSHQGIRYFRNAFFFYGIAFVGRYLFGVFSDFSLSYVLLVQVLFEYFLIMAGFFLLYSLIWRKFESQKEEYSSSLMNKKVFIFHAMAFILAVLDAAWGSYNWMFVSQIIIFFFASIIAFKNYRGGKDKHKMLKLSFTAMFIELIAWIFNLLAATYFQWSHKVTVGVGIINVLFFLLFLYGVTKALKK